MANAAQCYYCFEALAGSFRDREPADLAIIEDLWERYELSKKPLNLSAQAEDNLASDGDERGEEEHARRRPLKDEDDVDPLIANDTRSRPNRLQPPSISRLQSEISDSSSATTPSTTSNMSNPSFNSLSSTSTAITTPNAQSESLGSRQGSAEQRYPLFVTWDTLSRNGRKSLRGCIGTFEAQDLATGLMSYALTSAFEDTRFSPIPKSLIPSLACSLTLLGSFEPCTNALDWILGTHGLRISFIHRGRRYGATYLPDVAVEQGWTKEETVVSLMRKAGWDGGAGSVARRLLRGTGSGGTGTAKPWDQVSEFRAIRYQGLKASASYAEWQEWRNWVLTLDNGQEILGWA